MKPVGQHYAFLQNGEKLDIKDNKDNNDRFKFEKRFHHTSLWINGELTNI